uniref:T-complex protein 11 n=1 Tax=Mus musculus TaxID=10090 RepID=A0A3B2WCV7_MOUSE
MAVASIGMTERVHDASKLDCQLEERSLSSSRSCCPCCCHGRAA